MKLVRRVTSVMALFFLVGCASGDMAAQMIAHMDSIPSEERPPEWDRTRALMLRTAPQAGELAPDFTARRMNNDAKITLSEFHTGQPKVLIFGSYT